jgi:uncharacterized LabA/DUF88 family protein
LTRGIFEKNADLTKAAFSGIIRFTMKTTNQKDCYMEGLQQAVHLLAANVKELILKTAQKEKVVVFMDNSNLYGSIARIGRDLNCKFRIDYQKLYQKLVGDRFCINAFCFCSDWDIDEDQRFKRDGFQTMMQKTGFSLFRVPQRYGAVQEKGLDTAVVREMITIARDCPRADTFILIAGDGDYSDTIHELKQRHGIKVEVAFFRSETAHSLREAAYEFNDLEFSLAQIQLDRS